MFETETMAELCLKQGLVRDALLIYRRLLASAPDEPTRARHARRVAELEEDGRGRHPAGPVEEAQTQARPATEIQEHHDDQQVTLKWRLPDGTASPALQILVLRRDASGIAAERRTVRLAQAQGSLTLPIAGVHSVRAAAGKLDGERFVPLVRLDAHRNS